MPEQDYGVYGGSLGSPFDDHTPLTCTTAKFPRYVMIDPPTDSLYFAVVPKNSKVEGSYGGLVPSASACRPQQVGVCD